MLDNINFSRRDKAPLKSNDNRGETSMLAANIAAETPTRRIAQLVGAKARRARGTLATRYIQSV